MKVHTRNDYNEPNFRLSDPPDVQKLIRIFLSRWYWILASLAISGIVCFLFLKLTRPIYLATATLKFPAKQSEIDELPNLSPNLTLANTDYLSERYSLKSEKVIESALLKLDNPFNFFQLKDFRKIDIYPKRLLKVQVLSYNRDDFEGGTFEFSSPKLLTYKTNESELPIPIKNGTVVTVKGLSFKIDSIGTQQETSSVFNFNDPSERTRDFIKKIKVEEIEEGVPLLQISFKYYNAKFAENFLIALLESYKEYSLGLKKQSSDLSIDFIRSQLAVYQASLRHAASELELFKKRNQLPDLVAHTAQITARNAELNKQKNELQIQKKFIDLLESSISTSFDAVNYLPIGLDESTDQVLIKLLERYNELVGKRNELLLKNTATSPSIKNLEEALGKHRTQLLDNIVFQKKKNEELMDKTTRELSIFEKQVQQIPSLEKNFIYLQSNFEVNQNIYSLLLNKEIESSIFNAGILPSFTTISPPDKEKVFPDPRAVIPLAVLIGLMMGFGAILYARNLTQTFTAIEQIDAHPKVNLLGILPHFQEPLKSTNEDFSTISSDRSIFAESLKTIRTRLYFLENLETKALPKKMGRQILITSDKSGEGKSFVALSLAISLQKTEKSVILIGADLRKSNLHRLLKEQPKRDLGEYLENPSNDFFTLIANSGYPNLDLIPCEKKPISPSELLQKASMEKLLDHLRLIYDYIILDTAPIGLVSDNIPAFAKSDHILFVVRWLFSDKDAHRLPGQFANDYHLSQIHVVLNDYKPDDLYASVTKSSTYGLDSRNYYSESDYFSSRQQSWLQKLRETLKSN